MARPMVAENIPIKPVRLILGLIACFGTCLHNLHSLVWFHLDPGKLRWGEDTLWRLSRYRQSRTRLRYPVYR